MSKPATGWLPPTEAYYKTPPAVYVKTPDGDRPSARTMMQAWVQGMLSWPNGYYWGANPRPAVLLQQFTDYAQSLMNLSWSPWTTIGFHPVAEAIYHANVVMETLKQIPATMAEGTANPDASIYDIWITR